MMSIATHTMALAVPFLLLAAAGCTGVDTGNSQTEGVRITLGLTSTDTTVTGGLEGKADGLSAAPAGRDAQGTAFTVEAARANVRHIELDLGAGTECASVTVAAPLTCTGSTVTVPGPFVVDLMTGEATPSLAAIQIPAATYERIDVRFDDAKEADGIITRSDPLVDLTLVASGSFVREGNTTAFRLALKFNEDARFERAGGVQVGGGGDELLLTLDVAGWFSSLSLTDCLDDGDLDLGADGALEIEDGQGSCSDVESSLKTAIKRSGQLGE